ncbi:MAG: hypothetical protein FWB93_01980 [Oscillospiraceae bacterium]|nr:hypothetical protein [Oscillospiraceae bacterium]
MRLTKAINAYLEKADHNLRNELASSGFAVPGETVRDMGALEERLAAALKTETAFIRANLRSAVDLETFAQSWSLINDFNTIDDRLAEIFFDSFATNMPRLATAYIRQTDPWLAVTRLTNRTTAWARDLTEPRTPLNNAYQSGTNDTTAALTTTPYEASRSCCDFTPCFGGGFFVLRGGRNGACGLSCRADGDNILTDVSIIRVKIV